MRRTLILAAALLLTFGFAARSALADFSTGFESAEGYTGQAATAPGDGASTELLQQNQGWADQFGNFFDVHTYNNSAVTWRPPSVGADVNHNPPVNPQGGQQFVALGTGGRTSNSGGRDYHEADHGTGLVKVSWDFANGTEWDFPNFQGAVTSRSTGAFGGVATRGGNVEGIYAARSSDTNFDDPGTFKWAFHLVARPASDDASLPNDVNRPHFRNLQGGGPFQMYRFDNVPGFDDLPMNTWWGLSYTIDMATGRYTQLTSENIETGEMWVMDDPQAINDLTGQLEDMYIDGGGDIDPGEEFNLNAVGVYNVGWGTLSMFDNVSVVTVPEPSSFMLSMLGLLGLGMVRRRRHRRR